MHLSFYWFLQLVSHHLNKREELGDHAGPFIPLPAVLSTHETVLYFLLQSQAIF